MTNDELDKKSASQYVPIRLQKTVTLLYQTLLRNNEFGKLVN